MSELSNYFPKASLSRMKAKRAWEGLWQTGSGEENERKLMREDGEGCKALIWESLQLTRG